MMRNRFGEIMQFGYVVPDIEAGARQWTERVGAGPFYLIERLAMDDYCYRGAALQPEIRVAFGYWGDIQIELITPLDGGPSLYADAIAQAPGALNHCATIVEGLDALIAGEALESRIIQSGGQAPGTRYVYLDRYLPGDLHLELIEAPERARAGWAGMKRVHESWDGERPLRSMLGELSADIAALAQARF